MTTLEAIRLAGSYDTASPWLQMAAIGGAARLYGLLVSLAGVPTRDMVDPWDPPPG